MNFYSFSNFLESLSKFLQIIIFFKRASNFFINLYLSKQFINKSIWLFLGSMKRQNFLNEIIGSKTKFKILNFDQKFS